MPADTHIYCGVHAPIHARLPPHVAGRCEFSSTAAGVPSWCPSEVAAGDRLCPFHVERRVAIGHRLVAARDREQRHREALRAQAQAQRLADADAHAVHDQHLAGVRAQNDAAFARQRPFLAGLFAAAGEDGVVRAPPAPPLARAADLQRFAQDGQNVHTRLITKQTSDGEARLLSMKTDGRQVGLRVLRCFASRGSAGLTRVLRVANDVEYWYNQPTCRRVGDRLYARVLEGLWALIEQQPQEQRAELKVRLWEEASDSVGMCCEGHISRLVNVMVGFDEAFKPRMSVGESIQAKMAELAGKADLSGAEKVAQARAFLTELAVSAEEQAPWLEALE